MICINPQPETSPPIIKPRKDETLQSWLARKNHAMLFYNLNFGVALPGQTWYNRLVKYHQTELNQAHFVAQIY